MLLDVDDLTWRYGAGDRAALSQIAFKLEKGECLAVMGATGSGKTSLALAVRGIIPGFFEEGRVSGSITLDGVDVIHSDPQLICDRVGLVFQDPGSQVFGSTVLADVSFGLSNLGLPRKDVDERGRRYLQWTGLSEKHWRNSGLLSGGEAQRLALAGVLAMEPALLILDEPAAELDPVGRRELYTLLGRMRDEGRTILLVEQDPERVVAFADRVLVLDKGKVAMLGEPREIFQRVGDLDDIGVTPPELALLSSTLAERHGIVTNSVPLTSREVGPWISALVGRNDAASSNGLERPDATSTSARVPGEPVIEIEGLEYVYRDPSGDIPALRDVNVRVNEGEYVAIVGPNGAGKTTLTKHFNGLLTATAGTCRYHGHDIRESTLSQMAQHVGYCFQNPDHQIFERTVFDEITFGLRNLGVPDSEIQGRTHRIVERFGLTALARSHPMNLGRGERQKLALASIIVLEPEVLVIDEPTTGLDWRESLAILDLLDELNRQGTTLVVVTHDMRLVRERSRRCVAMVDGRVIFDGEPAELFANADICRTASLSPTPLVELYAYMRRAYPAISIPFPRTVEQMAEDLAAMVAGGPP